MRTGDKDGLRCPFKAYYILATVVVLYLVWHKCNSCLWGWCVMHIGYPLKESVGTGIVIVFQ